MPVPVGASGAYPYAPAPRASPGPKCLRTTGKSQNSRKVSGHRQLLSSAGPDHVAEGGIELV